MKSNWNVEDVFINDEVFKCEIVKYKEKMSIFYDKYIMTDGFDCKSLLLALTEYEDIIEFLFRVKLYISICYYDVNKTIPMEVEEIADDFSNNFKTKIASFPINISRHVDIKKFINDVSILNYKNFLVNIYCEKHFCLNRKCEEIIKLKAETGYHAFQQIYLDTFENAFFKLGKYEDCTYNQLLGFLNSEDYFTRKIASKKLGKFLKHNNELFTSLFNYTIKDLYIDKELRGYKSIYEDVFRENEFNYNDLLYLITKIREKADILRFHYRMRANRESGKYIEGINFTSDFQNRINFDHSMELIIKTVNKISPDYGHMVEKMFDERHIDYECREGKQSGSICFASNSKIMPYIFINFSGTISDLFTLAHEVGHAIHFMSSSINNTFLNYIPANLHAEILAIFFETLVSVEYLSEKNYSDDSVLEVSDNIIGKIFRQTINAIFEIEIRNKRGYASSSEIENAWNMLRDEFYGNTVKFYSYEKYNYWSTPHFICEPLLTAIYALSQSIAINLVLQKDEEGFADNLKGFMDLNANKSFMGFLLDNFNISFDNDLMWENAFTYLNKLIMRVEKEGAT